jgi:uncharacterized protein YndB with AHSA1/START domain
VPADANEKLLITRRLKAPRALVWDCYTQEKHLKNWWGPKGFTMVKCAVNLRVGGTFHYGMRAPGGNVMWGKWTFREIVAPERLAVTVAFSDEAGGITRHPMAPTWPAETYSVTTFTEEGNETVVDLVWEPENATPEEVALFASSHASMEAGFEGTYASLEAYLASLK